MFSNFPLYDGGGWMYLYSFICLSVRVIEWQPSCFVVILLHHAPSKGASVLVLFVIFEGLFLVVWYVGWPKLAFSCCLGGLSYCSSFYFAASRVQSTNWRWLTVPSRLHSIVFVIYFRSLNWSLWIRNETDSLNSNNSNNFTIWYSFVPTFYCLQSIHQLAMLT